MVAGREATRAEARLAAAWTDPAMQQGGYTDEAGDADHDEIADVVADWDAGRHERGDGWLQLTWLEPQEGATISARYFGN